MKKFKKAFAVVLALAVVLSMSMPVLVFAADDGSVTVNNAMPGEKYNIYKVFDLTYKTEQTTTEGQTTSTDPQSGVSYTYTKSGDSDALYTALTGNDSPFELTATSTANKYSVKIKSGKTGADIAAFLQANESKLTKAKEEQTAPAAAEGQTTSKVTWTGLPYGYYYVTSTVGSTVTIDSTMKNVVVEDKNTIPTQDKKQAVGTTEPTAAAGYTNDQQQVQVGDKVWYQIEVKDGKGTDKDIVITDTMTNGLTLDQDSIAVYEKVGNADEAVLTESKTYGTVVVNPTYAVSDKTAQGFKVTLKADYVKQLAENDHVYIRFAATVNSNAATDTDATKETNTSTITYSNQSSQDSVDVVTYKFQLDKVEPSETQDEYSDLLGAKFELYRGSVADANKISFIKGTAENNVPVLIVVPAGTQGAFTEIQLTNDAADTNKLESTKVIIKGLDKDNYVLRETKAPEGYNNAPDTTVSQDTLVLINGTITDTAAKIGNADTGVVSVVNNSGAELPSTGGIGTTIFYVLGAILVIGAGVLLVTRRRMKTN